MASRQSRYKVLKNVTAENINTKGEQASGVITNILSTVAANGLCTQNGRCHDDNNLPNLTTKYGAKCGSEVSEINIHYVL